MAASIRHLNGPADYAAISEFLYTLYQPDNRDGNWFQPTWEYAYTHAWFDDASIALYTEFVSTPGILTALANLDNSVIESLAKIVPGYINARWEGKPGIDVGTDLDVNMWFMFNFANDGRYQYTDYSERLEQFANQILDDAAAALNP